MENSISYLLCVKYICILCMLEILMIMGSSQEYYLLTIQRTPVRCGVCKSYFPPLIGTIQRYNCKTLIITFLMVPNKLWDNLQSTTDK